MLRTRRRAVDNNDGGGGVGSAGSVDLAGMANISAEWERPIRTSASDQNGGASWADRDADAGADGTDAGEERAGRDDDAAAAPRAPSLTSAYQWASRQLGQQPR